MELFSVTIHLPVCAYQGWFRRMRMNLEIPEIERIL